MALNNTELIVSTEDRKWENYVSKEWEMSINQGSTFPGEYLEKEDARNIQKFSRKRKSDGSKTISCVCPWVRAPHPLVHIL